MSRNPDKQSDRLGSVSSLVEHLQTLTRDLGLQTEQFGHRIKTEREEDILLSKELASISKDFLRRIEGFGLALDRIDAWQKELEGLIGSGSVDLSFDFLITQYMEQIKFLGIIVKQFADKVKACENCMDIEKYETLIKSHEEVLKSWAESLKSVEDLLKSKTELLYNLDKNREDLLKSYEELTKSGIEVEDKRLDLANKPKKKTEELLKSYEELLKSVEDLIKSIMEIVAGSPIFTPK